ncbi:MAG TPA: chemotaxis protein CheX [Candidatus Angelobacter sp.]|nr:chemotaxis protein CheX [Candidatus Angelobacter sp.]
MQGTVAEAIEHATLEVFALMVGVEIVAESQNPLAWPRLESNIVSSFRLSGSITGTAQVYYTLPLAKRMTRQILQVDAPVGEMDVLDAAGEVANMIVGSVKNSLENRCGPIQIGTPAVEITAVRAPMPRALSLSFRCYGDVFTVSVAFQEDDKRWEN